MLRWCLSTVRALGGHDTNSRRVLYITLRLSRSWFIRTYADASIPVANLVEESDVSIVASSSAQSCPTGSQDAFSASRCGNPLEIRDPCSAACSRTSYSAINALRQLLSPENVASDHPVTYSPTTIRSLYYRAESRNQLMMLDSRMLTLLIGLFGYPLASHFLGTPTRRTHWAFVLKVGRYKLTRAIPFQDSDRFWLMRAELAMIQAGPSSKLLHTNSTALSGDAYSAISRARTHYHIIRRHSRHPEVHAYYLENLLTMRDPRLLDFVACDLSFLLRNHRVCHPWLQRLLYRLVLQYGGLLSTGSQEAILSALWCRAFQGTGVGSDLVPQNGLSDMTLDDSISDTTTIARTLSTTLFGFTAHRSKDQPANSFRHFFSVFSPAHALPLRWNSLVLFSIFNSSETLPISETHWANDHATTQVTSCWQVIFGLATVEMILQKSSSALATQPTPTEGVLKTTRTLYQLWVPIIKSSSVSEDLACVVAASFLRIASILGDATLFYDCRALYHLENGSEGPRTSMRNFLATQYIAAAARVQGALPGVVLTALEAVSPDLKQRHQVLASAVEVLAPIDASLAYTVYAVAQGQGRELGPGATYALAMSFAERGAFRQAVRFINDGQFSVEKRGIFVSAIARSLRENPRTRHRPSVFVAIVNELAALYHSHVPPEHFRGHLEQLGRQLSPPRFFLRYCYVLLRHRQFPTASKLLDAITAVHPKITRSLCILTNRIVMQTKAFRMFKRVTLFHGPASLRLSSRLRRHPSAGPQLELSLQELLKSSRVLAAKRIFAFAASTIPSKRRTALGNILLYGVSRQHTSRNGRRVRKVLALMENLAGNYGFQPDRVTANILIKAMMGWRSAFDSPRLRELFDQLVRGGYPAADYSPMYPPFATRPMQLSGLSGYSMLPSFVSFEKHTRPLFKMFIKAFYMCNDVEAARKVVGILKVEGCKNAVAKEVRQRARSKGRAKAGMLLIPETAEARRHCPMLIRTLAVDMPNCVFLAV
ncbi:hypothetical protein V8E55_003809 [Tylopilus felleus]